MNNKINFTKRTLETLPIPGRGKRVNYYDCHTRNLLVKVADTGSKTFYYRRKVNGISEAISIGRYPEVTIEQARGRASDLSAAIARGENPITTRRPVKADVTLGEIFKAYLSEYARQNCSSWKNIEADLRRYLEGWFGRRLTDLSKSELQAHINQVRHNHGTCAANRTIIDAKAAINWAIKSEIIEDCNPFRAISKFRVQSRDRYLSSDELPRFFEALKALPNQVVKDYIFVSLFTGARRSNVLAMRWDELDLHLGVWRIPKTKNGDPHSIPLSRYALSVLIERHQRRTGEWVFPGTGGTGHLVEPKKSWHRLLKEAGITNLRLHDLRRTLGSYMAMANQSLPIIGKALGHKSPTSTQIYARLAYNPVREAMEKAQADMLAAAGLKS